MPVPAKTTVTHYRGDFLSLRLTVYRDPAQTEPADFTDSTITAQVRRTTESTEVAAEFEVIIEGNVIHLELQPKQTAALDVGMNLFDVECDWDSDERWIQTLLSGTIAIAPDVTRHATL